jgi:hypothetical protein
MLTLPQPTIMPETPNTELDDHELIAHAIEHWLPTQNSFQIPDRLPLLERYEARRPSRDAFAGHDVVFIQHHLGPLLPRLEAMVRAGLDPQRCWFVDIPYSTSTVVRGELGNRFPLGEELPLFEEPVVPYDHAQENRVHKILLRVAKRKDPKPLLVIDDGAYFVRFLVDGLRHDPDVLRSFAGARVVEQTTRGHRFLQEEANNTIKLFRLSVVSIARSATKLGFEAPFIGAAVAKAALGAFRKGHGGDAVAVMGYGAIGKATVRRLLDSCPWKRVDIVDVDTAARNTASEDTRDTRPCNVRASLDPETKYDLVVGCTGRGSIAPEDRHLLTDGALLVSGSSASVEFNRLQFFQLCGRVPKFAFHRSDSGKDGGIRSQITFRHRIGWRRWATFSFANAGFPVNFDGEVEHLPTEAMQATHCLLYAAARQVVRSTTPGFRPLELDTDLWIRNNAIDLLKQAITGGSTPSRSTST